MYTGSMETGNITYDALIAVYFSAPTILVLVGVFALVMSVVVLIIRRRDIKRRESYTQAVMESLGFDVDSSEKVQ